MFARKNLLDGWSPNQDLNLCCGAITKIRMEKSRILYILIVAQWQR